MKLVKITNFLIFVIFSSNLLFSDCSKNSNLNSNSNENSSQENSKLNGGIYLNENIEKHRKSRLNAEYSFKNRNSNLNKSTYRKNALPNQDSPVGEEEFSPPPAPAPAPVPVPVPAPAPTPTPSPSPPIKKSQSPPEKSVKLPKNGPFVYEGWVKYFKYTNEALTVFTPKEFIKNPAYYEQRKFFPKADFTKLNSDGDYDYIRNQNYFYLTIFKDYFVFNQSKKVQMQKVIDSFNIQNIEKVFVDPNVKAGGITDFGNFDEGFCLKISTKDASKIIYVLCFDTIIEKTEVLKLARMYKIEEQYKNGIFDVNPQDVQRKKKRETLSGILGRKDKDAKEKKDQLLTDGYWITLQEWSQCSLKCGGGTSTFHRMCVPPKNGGKPCQGEPILHKPCNPQPCPDTYGTGEGSLGSGKKNTEVLRPIVKIMPLTDLPQRYTKCKIKESDMMIYFKTDDPALINNPLMNGKTIEDSMGEINIPSRVIMNNSTLTVFSGNHYETLYQSYNLKKTKFFSSKTKKNCFELKEGSKKSIILCPFGCEKSEKPLEEWSYDFELFKNKCDRKPSYDPNGDAELQKRIKAKMDEARAAAIAEHNRQHQNSQMSKKSGDLDVLVKKTNNIALQAIQRELSLEDLIRQEEEEKNRQEEERLRKQIEAEKNKKNCVLKAIIEKKRENEYSMKTLEAQQRINAIKKEAAAQVMNQRNKLKALLAKIRQQSLLRRSQLKQELMEVRTSIASELGKAYKKGDINKCIDAMKNETTKNNYCTALYMDDFSFLNYCKKSDDFCNICCNAEFGDMHQLEKEECIIKTCPKKVAEEVEKNGRWTWQEKLSTKN